LTLKPPLKLDLCQTPLQAIDFKGEKQGVQLESSPVYEGIKTQRHGQKQTIYQLESSPVYEGIKT